MVHWAVVGAGIAGLSAARALTAGGAAVTVFDRGRQPGGRASARLRPDGSFDHGAQYFTAANPRFVAVVRELQQAGYVSAWDGRIVAMDSNGVTTPSTRKTRLVGTPDMGSFARALGAGLDLRLETAVTAIAAAGSGWRLEGVDDRDAFDGVLLAMPPEQARRLIPVDHAFGRVVEGVASVPCWAGLVTLAESPELPYDGAFIDHDVIAWIACDSTKPGRQPGHRWVVHATAEWSAARYDAAPEAVATELLEVFHAVTRVRRAADTAVAAHRWGLARVEVSPESVDGALYDERSQLAVCGDWCVEPRIEGAFTSGSVVARAILAHG